MRRVPRGGPASNLRDTPGRPCDDGATGGDRRRRGGDERGACGIPYLVGGLFDDADRLISRSPDEFREAGIDVRTRCEVTAIDLDRRTVAVRDLDARSDGEESFDQLVYAAGAVATAPPVPGAELCEPVRTVEHAERFRARLERSGGRRAVVIGASYLGRVGARSTTPPSKPQRDIP